MNNEEIIKRLDGLNQKMNGIIGRLTVPAMRDETVRQAHSMSIEVGDELDDLINDLI